MKANKMDNNNQAAGGPIFRPPKYQIGIINGDVKVSLQRKHRLEEVTLRDNGTYTVDPDFYDWLKAMYPNQICNLNYKPVYLLVRAFAEGEFNVH